MPITSVKTINAMSPKLVDVMRTTQSLSAAERLFLAKTLLDSLVHEEAITGVEQKIDQADPLPSLEEVVAQIKATPPNPQQIQRATKTIDKVMTEWAENPPDEPRLTTEEWEQTWWAVRQEMKQRDRNRDADPQIGVGEDSAAGIGRSGAGEDGRVGRDTRHEEHRRPAPACVIDSHFAAPFG